MVKGDSGGCGLHRSTTARLDHGYSGRCIGQETRSSVMPRDERSGDLLLLEGRWSVTHAGLLRLARHSHCAGISVEAVPEFSDPASAGGRSRQRVTGRPSVRASLGMTMPIPRTTEPTTLSAG